MIYTTNHRKNQISVSIRRTKREKRVQLTFFSTNRLKKEWKKRYTITISAGFLQELNRYVKKYGGNEDDNL